MKKIATILLLLIYTSTSFGLGIKQFYCCGKLKTTSISFVQTSKDDCNKSESENCNDGNELKKCCKTEFHSFKVKDAHKSAEEIFLSFKYVTEQPDYQLPVLPVITEQTLLNNYYTNAPPKLHGVAAYIFHCIYLI